MKIVRICVAPNASEAALSRSGTAFIDVTLILMMVGSIIIARTIIAASIFDPPVN